MINLKISEFKKYFYCFLLLTPLVKPPYFSTIDILNKVYNYSLYLVFVIVFLLYLKRRSINYSVIPIIILYLYTLGVTVYKDGDIKTAIKVSIGMITLIGIIELFSSNLLIFIKTAYYYLEFYLYINFILVLIKPEGLYSRYTEAYGFTEEHFLSAKNFFIFWLIPALFLGLLLFNKRIIRIRFLVFIAVMLLNQLFYGSGTGIMVICTFIILSILPLLKYFENLATIILSGVALNIFIVSGKTLEIFDVITGLIGKDSTFTNRDKIWENAVSAVNNNLLFGHGVMDSEEIAYIFGNFPGNFIWLGATHAHNQFLQILFETGIVGGVLLIAYLFLLVKNTTKLRDGSIYKTICIFVLIYFIAGITEYFSFVMLNIILILPIYLINMEKEEYSNG